MIYLDNNATTRLDPAILPVMLPFLTDDYANPSSPCTFSRRAALAIARARAQVAALVGSNPDEIVFTSGGTESNNSIIKSTSYLQSLEKNRTDTSKDWKKPRLVVFAAEHASIRNLAIRAAECGASVGWLGMDGDGLVSTKEADELLRTPADLMCIMTANNETGVVAPIADLAAIATRHNVAFHTDAVQAAGKIPLNLAASGVHFASLGAHKIHGPKGVGALYIRKGSSYHPLLAGGDQENGLRAGTENVAGIVGFGAAAELAAQHLDFMNKETRRLRDEFESRVTEFISDIIIAGRAADRLPNTSMLLIPGCETEALLTLLDLEQICVSSGSACTAGAHEPSHVLRAMGLPTGRDTATVRVSLSRFTTPAEVNTFATALIRNVRTLRTR